VLALSGAVFLTGCGGTTSNTTAATSGHASGTKYTVVPLRIDSNSGQIEFDTGFNGQAQKYGWTVLPALSAQDSAGTQLAQVHTAVDQGAQGLMIDAADTNGIIPAIQYAGSKGAKVVAIDNLPSSGKGVYVGVTSDNQAMAESACLGMGPAIHGKGVVLAVEGALNGSAGLDRQNGFTNCMKTKYPNVQVVQLVANWLPATASSLLATALTKYPHPAGIFVASYNPYASPLFEALKAKGLTAKAGQPGHVYLAGVDNPTPALQAIANGTADLTVAQATNKIGQVGAEFMKDAFNGVKLQAGQTVNGYVLKDVGGYPVAEVPAPVITKANVNQ
jgi:ABC-type sugar transport system substrate-binding protein